MGILTNSMGLKQGGMVAIVGGGGKTTLMFRLAHEMALEGSRVLTTTTTHILEPWPEQSRCLLIEEKEPDLIDRIVEIKNSTLHITAAKKIIDSHGRKKLLGLDAAVVERLAQRSLFDWILTEADGASQKPLKAPAHYEPVIPANASWVIAMAGLESVGKPNKEPWVFRNKFYSQVTGLPEGEPVTEESIVAVVLANNGLFRTSPAKARKIVFLNKAENTYRILAGKHIAEHIIEKGEGKIHGIVIGALQPKPVIIEKLGF